METSNNNTPAEEVLKKKYAEAKKQKQTKMLQFGLLTPFLIDGRAYSIFTYFLRS